jgi:hypothetical protein
MCKHPSGFITMTDRRVKEAAIQNPLYRPRLYILEGSSFIVKRCNCSDAPPIDEDVYIRLLWPDALRMVGAEQGEQPDV